MGLLELMKLFASMMQVALVLTTGVRAQSIKAGTKHFEKAGLTFDFPAEWTLTDKSSDSVLYFSVASQGSSTQISVIDQSASFSSPCDQSASKTVTDALLLLIATQIHAATPLQTAPVKIQIGSAGFEGVQLHGSLNNQPVTVEVYEVKERLRLVNLVHLRLDSDLDGRLAWQTILPTMAI